MNTDGIVERLSERTGLKKRTCEKIIVSILETIESDLAIGIPFTIESVGTICKSSNKTSVQSLSDGSFRVFPPKSFSEFIPYSNNDSLKALRSAQRAVSALASGVVDSYKDAETSYKEFSRIIRKSLSKGKKIKITGIGIFKQAGENISSGYSDVEFAVSQKLDQKLNDNFDSLEEKIIFPIPPISLTTNVLDQDEKGVSNFDISGQEENNFMKKKLTQISQDLIRLNEEINGKTKKNGGSALWG
ncbi:MAG: HU family DNA-binding protein [Ignavibacteria bacterium]|nr:HU family DNA-binding protein [Ignavibacteria bacterium]